jgi:site-specific DNA recombinase
VFALAQEQLEKNKRHSPRRTIEPTLLQGILVCEQCGYGLYRTSTHTSKHKLNYYRCIGSDGYRRLNGPICTNRPIRQDHLDQFVWSEIIRLLDDPCLIQSEIDRRREAAQKADPLRKREEELRREQARVEKSSERLVTAYQEGLLTLPQLRQRIPPLQKQTQAVESELQSLKMAAVDEAKYLQLAENLAGFRSKLRVRAEALDIAVRQQILRLLVKEVLVGGNTITLRHSIPIPQSGPASNRSPTPSSGVTGSRPNPSYLLRSGSHHRPLRSPHLRLRPLPILRYSRLQPFLDQPQYPWISHSFLDQLHQLSVVETIEKSTDIGVQNPVHLLPHDPCRQRVQCIMGAPSRPESIRKTDEVLFVDRMEDRHHRLLNHFVLHGGDSQWTLPPVGFRYIHSP